MSSFISMPFLPSGRPRWYGPMGFLVALFAVALATGVLWLAQPIINLGSVYLIYLVVVVAVAVGWGLPQGVVASVLAFLAANFFFIEPRFTFTVANFEDLLALVIFLGLATLTSQLVARLRREALEARRGQAVTAALYALSQTINSQHDVSRLLNEAAVRLRDVLDLAACVIAVDDQGDLGAFRAVAGEVPGSGVGTNAVRLPIRLADRSAPVGEITAVTRAGRQPLQRDERQLLTAFADQLQVALDRHRLAQAAIGAEVLRRTDALRVALLSAVAHDLRTPLTSIKTAATSLLNARVEWSEDDKRDFLQSIVSQVDHINHLVSNLLDVSRIEEGRLRPNKEPHRIGEIIDTVLERLQPTLAAYPVDTKIEPGIPEVLVDAVEIDEVLTNLLENAVRYTKPGTPVHIRARRAGDSVEVAIADEGPGIPPESLPHLFHRFYRVMPGRGGARGWGLGLAIVKGVVEAHGGSVSAANRPGGGAVFTFTLPLRAAETPATQNGNMLPQLAGSRQEVK